jgi:hypothetical protein
VSRLATCAGGADGNVDGGDDGGARCGLLEWCESRFRRCLCLEGMKYRQEQESVIGVWEGK